MSKTESSFSVCDRKDLKGDRVALKPAPQLLVFQHLHWAGGSALADLEIWKDLQGLSLKKTGWELNLFCTETRGADGSVSWALLTESCPFFYPWDKAHTAAVAPHRAQPKGCLPWCAAL